MFNWFKRNHWRQSSPHLLFLSRFTRYDSPDNYKDAERWKTALGESPVKVIRRLEKDGMLCQADLPALLSYRYKVTELKSMLRDRQLKVSGPKAELIIRLLENDLSGMKKYVCGVNVLRCTSEGMELATEYQEKVKSIRKDTEDEVFRQLKEKSFVKAAKLVAAYEASQVFPRGVGMDWGSKRAIGQSVEVVKDIYGKPPGILNGVDRSRLQALQDAAAMMSLWGTSKVTQWLPAEYETGIHLGPEASVRMLVFHAYHLRNMKRLRQSSAKTVEVLGVGDSKSCSACRKMAGKKFKLKDVPEIPCPACSSEMGCRCSVVIHSF